MYVLNYHPGHDCWYVVEGVYTSDLLAAPHYVCTPPLWDYPIRRIAAMYDGKPRKVYTYWLWNKTWYVCTTPVAFTKRVYWAEFDFTPCDQPFAPEGY